MRCNSGAIDRGARSDVEECVKRVQRVDIFESSSVAGAQEQRRATKLKGLPSSSSTRSYSSRRLRLVRALQLAPASSSTPSPLSFLSVPLHLAPSPLSDDQVSKPSRLPLPPLSLCRCSGL